jgi:hypothetical protein
MSGFRGKGHLIWPNSAFFAVDHVKSDRLPGLIMSGACTLSALKVDILVLPGAVLVDDV